MKRKFLTVIMLTFALFSTFVITNKVHADSKYGTVESLVGEAEINGTENIVVKYNKLDLTWAEADPDVGRMMNGWWIGIKIKAPDGMTEEQLQKSTYEIRGQTVKFWDVKDSTVAPHYVNAWVRIGQEMIEGKQDVVTIAKYELDWDDDKTPEQTITIQVVPTEVNLKRDSTIVSVKVGDRQFTLKKDKTLNDLPEADKKVLETLKTPEEGKVFVGLFNNNVKFDETTPIETDIELEVRFEDEPKESPTPETPETPENPATTTNPTTPTTPETQESQDETPKTGTVDIIEYVVAITMIAGIGIVVLSKKH